LEFSVFICSFAGEKLKEGSNMCTCIDTIKASYSEVKRETSRVARRSFQNPVEVGDNAQVSVDDFLDTINVITRELHQVTTSVNDLVDVVRINFCQITPQEAEELLELSEPINKKMQVLHKKLQKSPLYVGMETVVKLYEEAMGGFDELCHDLQTFRINLEENKEFQNLLKNLNESLSR